MLAQALRTVRWDILATNLTKRESRYFKVNDILKSIDDQSLSVFMDAFLAGITTIPYFKAIMIDGDYCVEGGYLDNTRLASIFQDPESTRSSPATSPITTITPSSRKFIARRCSVCRLPVSTHTCWSATFS